MTPEEFENDVFQLSGFTYTAKLSSEKLVFITQIHSQKELDEFLQEFNKLENRLKNTDDKEITNIIINLPKESISLTTSDIQVELNFSDKSEDRFIIIRVNYKYKLNEDKMKTIINTLNTVLHTPTIIGYLNEKFPGEVTKTLNNIEKIIGAIMFSLITESMKHIKARPATIEISRTFRIEAINMSGTINGKKPEFKSHYDSTNDTSYYYYGVI